LIFKEIDKDGSLAITKDEMVDYLLTIL